MSQKYKSAAISFNSSGDNIAVASSTNPIQVYGIIFTVNGATNITMKDGSTALTGAFIFIGNGSNLSLPIVDEPWFTAKPGNNFNINSSNAVLVGGILYYTS